MAVLPWRWSFLALLIVSLGCQAAPSPPSGQTAASDTPDTAWANAADLIPLVLAQVEDRDLCDGFFDPEVAATESQVYVLGDRALVEVLCARAAYQMVYAYAAVASDGTLTPLSLDGFYPDEAGNFQRVSEPTVGGLASFDPSQGQLTIFSKARGIGDCGSFATYGWTGEGLALETYRYQACNDDPNGVQTAPDPENFPQIYP